jgi:hypothetical protein
MDICDPIDRTIRGTTLVTNRPPATQVEQA